jgi:hypothetical protein
MMDGSRRWSNVIGTGIDPSPLKNKVLTVNGQAPDENGNVEIGGSGIQVSGAVPGQFLKVAEVDEKGVPTAWETAEIPVGGEKEWTLLDTVVITEKTKEIKLTGLAYKEILVDFENLLIASIDENSTSAPSAGGLLLIANGEIGVSSVNNNSAIQRESASQGMAYLRLVGSNERYRAFGWLSLVNKHTNIAGSQIMGQHLDFAKRQTTDTINSIALSMNSYSKICISSGTFRIYGR